jgi:hypothetical protein
MTPAPCDIIVDSGAVPTFVHNLAYIEQPVFHDSHISPLPTVSLADGTAVDINASGTFMGMHVDYVPNFPNTLLSVSQYCTPTDSHPEHIALFTATNMYGCTVDPIMRSMLSDLYHYAHNHSMIDLSAKCVDGLYRTNQHTLQSCPSSTPDSASTSIPRHCMMSSYQTVQFTSLPELVLFFHRLWQHPSQSKMLDIVRNRLVTNYPAALTPDAILRHFPTLCPDCPVGNLSRSPLPRISASTFHEIGSEIVLDIKGPWTGSDGKPVKSFSGHLYTLTARDRMSEYLWGFPLSDRKHLLKYIMHLHNHIRFHNRVLHVIHCDDEFDQVPIRDYCAMHGISMKLCVPYEHGQLGFIERSHRTIQDAVVKSLHNAPHITAQFWAMAYLDTIDKLNILPCVHNPLTSPYSLWYGHPYDMSVHPMLPFGTLVMAHLPLELQHALSGRSFETFYVRSAHEHKNGLLLFNPVTKRCIVRRTFKALGFSKIPSPVYDIDADYVAPSDVLSDITYPAEHHSLDMMNDPVSSSTLPTVLPLTRHVRFSDVLTYMDDDSSSPRTDITPPPVPSRSRIGTTRTDPLQSLSEHHHLALASATYTPPRVIDHNHFTIQQALRSPYAVDLCGAVRDEIASLRKMNAIVNCDIDPTSIPKHQLVRSLLLIDRLFNPDGSFKKNKARIVARGDDWNPLIPFDVYAGTVKSESIRILLSIIACEDMEMACADVKTAFLYPDLNETLYMRRPPGLPSDFDFPPVVKLNKCIYGLPQASAAFRLHSDTHLRSDGFIPCISDPCLYTKCVNGIYIYVSVHVDDFGIASKSSALISAFLDNLRKTYTVTVVHEPTSYLGMHITRNRTTRTISLSQPHYIDDMLAMYNVDTVNNIPTTPMTTCTSLLPDTHPDAALMNAPLTPETLYQYQSRLGTLLFLACQSRPDILYAVNHFCRRVHSAIHSDYLGVNRILRYIAATRDITLDFHSDDGIVLYASVDASYACHSDLRSHTGCTLHIGRTSGCVMAITRKQTVMADSSTVAEYIAAATACKEIMWARDLLHELGYTQQLATVLLEDNQSTIALIQNGNNGNKTKHIGVRFNLIREQVADGVVRMQYCDTLNMPSDMLTKPTPPSVFLHLRPLLQGTRSGEHILPAY